jgi:GTP-binding protein
MILAASKCDVANKSKLAKLKKYAKAHDLELFVISAVTGEGIEKLKYAMADRVEQVRRDAQVEARV